VCFLLAYRPPQLERLQAPRIEVLPQFTRIELHELTKAEAENAIRAKLVQLYPERGGALPKGLVEALMQRSQGNPFYLEELLNYMRDRGLDPADIENIKLPDSLHTLILSRIDQLSEQEKTTLRVASIIGRLFRFNWLMGYYPDLGPFLQVKAVLVALETLDITPMDSPEPELTYLFKHIVTHEVTYESLPYTTRAHLHEQLARYLESIVGVSLESSLLDTIAYHYLHSENNEKQREYLFKAGEAAQKNYANDAALEYYGKLLPLLEDENEQTQIHLKRGKVLELMGKWDEAETDYRAALDSAKDDFVLKASSEFALGRLYGLRGDYSPAMEWLDQAKEARTRLKDTSGLAQIVIVAGAILVDKGEYDQASLQLAEGLELAEKAGDKLSTVSSLSLMGDVAFFQGDYVEARALHEKSLTLFREMGSKSGISSSLRILGVLVLIQGDNATAQVLYEESLALSREMGDKQGEAKSLSDLGSLAVTLGNNARAWALLEESLTLFREMGRKWSISLSLSNMGFLAFSQGDYTSARVLLEECLVLSQEVGNKTILASTLLGLGLVDLAEHKTEARKHIMDSLNLRRETGENYWQTTSLIGVAGLVLHEGKPLFAAKLLGAVESALKRLNAVMEPEVIHFHAQTLAEAREQLGEATFLFAWNQGREWSLEEAVQIALEVG
jgi:adenylate cyclase